MAHSRFDRLALIRLGLLVAIIGGGTVVVLVAGVPDAASLRMRFHGTGVPGVLAFSGLYAVLTLTPVPAGVLTIAAGAAFGLVSGSAVMVLGATTGAIAAFYLGRWLGRDGVQGLAGRRLASLDRLMRRRGVLSVLLVRLVPLFPYAAVNYLSGLTAVRVRDYVIGTIIGILPAGIAYVAVGAYGSKPGSTPFLIALAALALLTAGALVVAHRHRNRGEVSRDRDVPAATDSTGG
ncbi:MAG: TVP38/TMEM64 family protein [Jatrophihabitans sp.]